MKKILDFVCIGAQKAGTTTLHDILQHIDEITLPTIKETKFFHDGELKQYQNGIEWYFNKYFSCGDETKVVGEIDPEYMYFEEVPIRLFNHNNNLKIIAILRNPAERAYSHYQMSFARGIETEEFEIALKLESRRLNTSEYNMNHFSYFSRGLYYEQLLRYYELFDSNNILIIEFKELLKFEESIPKILGFLGIHPSIVRIPRIHSNKARSVVSRRFSKWIHSGGKLRGKILTHLVGEKLKFKIKAMLIQMNMSKELSNKIDPLIYAKLMQKYRADIHSLSELTGRDFKREWQND